MGMLKIRKPESQIEKRILMGSITSRYFLKELTGMIDFSYFTNTYIEKTIDWCLDFFYEYDTQPGQEIVNILEEKSFGMPYEEKEMYNGLIADVVDRYVAGERVNEERLVNQTVLYFKKRELEITSGNIRVLLEKEDVLGAERELLNFKNIAKTTSTWENPFTNENILTYFDGKKTDFFKMPGKLGDLLGAWEKGWLVALCGPFKRGKTWMLLDFAVCAMLSKKKVVFITLEMTIKQLLGRLYKRLVPGLDDAEVKGYLYPCFDCFNNQLGNCTKPERINDVTLIKTLTLDMPTYEEGEEIGYSPCSVCRGTSDFKVTSWWEKIDIPEFEVNMVGNKLDKFTKFNYDRFLRIKKYPRFSASCSDIERDLDILEATEGFDAEIIIVDYAGIVKPNKDIEGVEKEDSVWMALASMAGKRDALLITADQVTREALDVSNVKRKHTAKWIGKLAHVDAMYTINQTESEKERGLMRIGVMDHRHIDYSQEKKVTVLQHLKTGQSNIDSEL